jgi:4-hydroxy-2-oxoheptanedioate aldolase
MSFLTKIHSGETVFGTCITSSNPLWPAILEGVGVDFVFIDTEHISLSRETMADLCQTYRGRGITPIVRVIKCDHHLISQALDAGAKGIVVPYVESADEIKVLVAATKLRPLKGEALSAVMKDPEALSPVLKDYFHTYNEGMYCIANIESVPAVERLDEILSVSGLDGVFIGPHDLSVSLGIPEQYDHPEFLSSVRRIISTCKQYHLAVGIHFSSTAQRQQFWMKEGVNLVVHSSDLALFKQRLEADFALLKPESGPKRKKNTGGRPII